MTKQKGPAVSDRPVQIDLFGAASSPVLPRAQVCRPTIARTRRLASAGDPRHGAAFGRATDMYGHRGEARGVVGFGMPAVSSGPIAERRLSGVERKVAAAERWLHEPLSPIPLSLMPAYSSSDNDAITISNNRR